jgi:hypothetical protein
MLVFIVEARVLTPKISPTKRVGTIIVFIGKLINLKVGVGNSTQDIIAPPKTDRVAKGSIALFE